MKKLKIVTINYNQSSLTVKFINEIYKQSFTDFDLIVVDNNSASSEIDIIKNYTLYAFILIESNRNLGFSYGNNVGAKYKSDDYEFTLFMNNDSYFTTINDLQVLVEKFEKNIAFDIVALSPLINTVNKNKPANSQHQNTNITNYYENLVVNSTILHRLPILRNVYNRVINRNLIPYDTNIDYLSETINGTCFIVLNSFLENIGYFDEGTFLYGEEMIFGYQVQSKKKLCLLVTNVIVDHYQGSTTKNDKFNIKMYYYRKNSELYYLKKYLGISVIKKIIFYIVRTIDLYSLMLMDRLIKKD